eukprot:2595809-Rhodomonas_salina.2
MAPGQVARLHVSGRPERCEDRRNIRALPCFCSTHGPGTSITTCSPAVVIDGSAIRICCALCSAPCTAQLTEISPPVAPSEKVSSFVMLRLAPVSRHAQATGSAEGVGSW